MATAHKRGRKVGQNLFRYSANKTYYAVFKVGGKKIWKSLETADRALADRKLAAELRKRGVVDPRQSRMTLAQLLVLTHLIKPVFQFLESAGEPQGRG